MTTPFTEMRRKSYVNASARAVFSEKEKLHVIITFREINSSNFLTRLYTDRVDNRGGV